jgi:hypothetical protein
MTIEYTINGMLYVEAYSNRTNALVRWNELLSDRFVEQLGII